jgi:large subunit ribosomal protein L25
MSLAAERRDRAGKGAARAARRSGRIPGVVYGDGKAPLLISLEYNVLDRARRNEGFFSRLLDLKVDGADQRVLPREIQLDPVSDKPMHADFLRVGPKTRVSVAVPVHFENETLSPGLKRGGVLNVVRYQIELYCQADSIPGALKVDLSGLDIGHTIHISAVKLPEGVKPVIADRDFTVASITAPTIIREEVPAAATTEEGVPAEGAEAVEGAPAEGAAAVPAAAPAEPEKKGRKET